ncbi:hypothetical protein U4I36_12760 [Stenotrophomonas maltophilia]|uniref:hypothetical protein n=1 Tax=Stenotrophomonas maltophilia TaxID=40324 RepID=UPI000D675456|nr:hypothetical protein [Stenotrophomonas maltophilia]MBH1417667.1 hypothetical protein [Stenotrophomonas maltophilia]MBH1813570.1 hypothetical protein [Stenotrophomonas maltophilia]MBH1822641.1 hypothetical protein [Stenotrophomonas maltophilia]MDZ5776051.1 hypothetical protein [Stenotrophomonas maltophilia]MDZ5805086.1 hypothetical protein [Stenotrophomonas maltophilia]
MYYIAKPKSFAWTMLTALVCFSILPIVGAMISLSILFVYFFFSNPRHMREVPPQAKFLRKQQWKTVGIWSAILFVVFYIFLLGIPQMLLIHGWAPFF